jgi:hypothetical protein
MWASASRHRAERFHGRGAYVAVAVVERRDDRVADVLGEGSVVLTAGEDAAEDTGGRETERRIGHPEHARQRRTRRGEELAPRASGRVAGECPEGVERFERDTRVVVAHGRAQRREHFERHRIAVERERTG